MNRKIISIMIVEDEVIIAADLKRRLIALGYNVPATAVSSKSCLDKLKTITPDLILMDIYLKGEDDGIKTADIISDKYNIPVVFLTAHSDEQTLQRAKVTSSFGYILKPFEIKDLRITIEFALYKFQMEGKLKKLNEKLENKVAARTYELNELIQQSPFAIRAFDVNGGLTFSNLKWDSLTKDQYQDLVNSTNLFEDPILIKCNLIKKIKSLIKNKTGLVSEDVFLEPISYDDNEQGLVLTYKFFLLINEQKEVYGIVNLIEDITYKRIAQESAETIKLNLETTRKVFVALEEERQRISRELHDSIGQLLYAAKYNLEVYERTTKNENDLIKNVKDILINTSVELRNIIFSLSPTLIDKYGLKVEIIKLIELINSNYQIQIEGNLPMSLNFDKEVSLNIFRIIQEAFNNIIKHSHAKKAWLDINFSGIFCYISIIDNGDGISENVKDNGFGIATMSERVKILNGNFSIEPNKPRGTKIYIEIPIK